jgi:acyl-CoA synthetase (NDP forming)
MLRTTSEDSTARTLARVLLAPCSVAIIGQSDDATKTAGRPLKYLRQAGYAGRIYPVNPHRAEVLGERAWPSVAALPEVPEHAYIVTPTDAVIDAVEQAASAGVEVATVLADGFAEAGPVGQARAERLREIATRTGTRIVGPSSLGVVDLRSKLFLTANAAFEEKDIPTGRIFAASQSGGMIGAFLSRGMARGIHFAGFVSVGSELDLSIGEICSATLEDPGIAGYLLFVETIRKGDALRAFALAAAERGRPIIAYKAGRSAEAREVALSHTGALAGEDDVAGAFLADCGIARVDTLEGLIEGFPLVARIPIPERRPRRSTVAVVATTAGGATMVVDSLATRGVAIGSPSKETLARISSATGIDVAPARIVDLTLAGARYDAMKAALDILTRAPEFDLVVAVVGSSARFFPERAVKPIIDSVGEGSPLAAFLVPEAPRALAQLAAAGVPCFHTPEACADAIAAALKRRRPKPMASQVRAYPGAEGRRLDEREAYDLLDRLGIPHAPAVVLEPPLAQAPALPFQYPVAVKVLSAAIAHKSDAGGVALWVADGDALLVTVRQLCKSVAARTGVSVDRVLVQPMVAGVAEVLIGYRVDPDAGPIVLVSVGGLHTEIYRDRALRLAPVVLEEAREMVTELRALSILTGYRGRPAGDLDALALAIVALSQLAVTHDPVVSEAEINPLIVRPAAEGVVAVDALVKLAGSAPDAETREHPPAFEQSHVAR